MPLKYQLVLSYRLKICSSSYFLCLNPTDFFSLKIQLWKMYSRWILRSLSTPMLINRCFSTSPMQLAAATKLKEKSTNETTITKSTNEKPVEPPSTLELNKVYSDKIHRLVDEISKLSLVDVMDLNELLKVIISMSKIHFIADSSIENIENSRRADCGFGRSHWPNPTSRTGTSQSNALLSVWTNHLFPYEFVRTKAIQSIY